MKDISNLLSPAWGYNNYFIYYFFLPVWLCIALYSIKRITNNEMKQFLLILINYFAVLGLSRCKDFNRRQDVKNSYDIQFYAKFL